MAQKKKRKTPVVRMSTGRTAGNKITAETPLTPQELKFAAEYIRSGDTDNAIHAAGLRTSKYTYLRANQILNRPNVQAEVMRMMDEIKQKGIADAEEIMLYFTKVMRGEVKDQFGLEASLMERTKAAQELAKRTIDVENRKKDIPDNSIKIKLDWGR